MFRFLLRGFVVLAAGVVPFLAFRVVEYWPTVKSRVSAVIGASTALAPEKSDSVPAQEKDSKDETPAQLLVEGPAVRDMAELFRFDISAGWIMQRWSRVSTGMAQLQLQGYRVPLVTGTAPSDLAGSLTYYFNPKQQLEKITFAGSTGDASRLVQLLTRRYGFARRLTNDSGIFLYESVDERGKVQSVLKIRPTGILKKQDRHNRFQVDLMLNRPEREQVAAASGQPTKPGRSY